MMCRLFTHQTDYLFEPRTHFTHQRFNFSVVVLHIVGCIVLALPLLWYSNLVVPFDSLVQNVRINVITITDCYRANNFWLARTLLIALYANHCHNFQSVSNQTSKVLQYVTIKIFNLTAYSHHNAINASNVWIYLLVKSLNNSDSYR